MNLHSIIISPTLLCPKNHERCLQILSRSPSPLPLPSPSPCSRTSLRNCRIGERSQRYNHRFLCYEKKEERLESREELQPVTSLEKKGTVAGAMAFVIGTSIGSGILALPEKASPAGFFPSSISIILCWGFLLVEALVLVEISVVMWREKKKKNKKNEEGEKGMEVISVRTMAQETLGDFGGTLATVAYVLLGYASMVAYISKSGEILLQSFNLPSPISGFLFTLVFTLLISIGRTRTIDQVNQWLTACMIGLLVGIEVLAVQFGGWFAMEGEGDWRKVPTTIPVIIFALVYHDVIPVLCAYLDGDLPRLRVSVLLGSFIPLIALLVWDAIALGLLAQADQVVDPVELLLRWSGVSYMVEWFSLLAVGTSILGTLLSFSEFFKEQLSNIFSNFSTTETLQEPSKFCLMRNWWEMNKVNLTAMSIAVGPSLLVSVTNPDSFSAATDIAGGYCMTILYGVLPPAMAWAMHSRESEDTDSKSLLRERPALLGLGLFACGIMVEQVLQDILKLQS